MLQALQARGEWELCLSKGLSGLRSPCRSAVPSATFLLADNYLPCDFLFSGIWHSWDPQGLPENFPCEGQYLLTFESFNQDWKTCLKVNYCYPHLCTKLFLMVHFTLEYILLEFTFSLGPNCACKWQSHKQGTKLSCSFKNCRIPDTDFQETTLWSEARKPAQNVFST